MRGSLQDQEDRGGCQAVLREVSAVASCGRVGERVRALSEDGVLHHPAGGHRMHLIKRHLAARGLAHGLDGRVLEVELTFEVPFYPSDASRLGAADRELPG